MILSGELQLVTSHDIPLGWHDNHSTQLMTQLMIILDLVILIVINIWLV